VVLGLISNNAAAIDVFDSAIAASKASGQLDYLTELLRRRAAVMQRMK